MRNININFNFMVWHKKAVYVSLFLKKIINKDNLYKYGKNNSLLMTHISHKVPGVEFSTGSLGHGLPFATGKAFYAKKFNKTIF